MDEPQLTLCEVYNLTEAQADGVTAFFQGFYEEGKFKNSVQLKTVLSLIRHQAAGENRKFRDMAIKLAEDLAPTNGELSSFILAQYDLIPTFGTGDLEKDHEIRNGDMVKFKGFPDISEDRNFQVNIVGNEMKIVEVKPL